MTQQKRKESLLTQLRKSLDSQQLMTRLVSLGYKDPAPYHVISGPELSRLLNVSDQTLANWRMRGLGPKPEPSENWKGHRNYYKLADLLAYFDSCSPSKIYCDWVRSRFSYMGTETAEDCERAIQELIRMRIFPQPKWKRKWRPHIPKFQILGGVL